MRKERGGVKKKQVVSQTFLRLEKKRREKEEKGA